ncbi:T9SS type A sorting domain-containing protein, partial [Maribellus mangrovi]|uniref:T9SS type A sorting domain-containing protein n=1 Tax=Maribellus mangrovi TaxID=3133146 RepID=UPI0030EBA064
LIVPVEASFECELGDAGTATAEDNCGGDVSIVYWDDVELEHCGTITRTWKATDCAGNTTTDVQIITIYDDTPPVIDAPEDSVICEGDTVPMMLMASWTDNCADGGDLYAEAELYSVSYCDSIFAYPFYAMDNCDNEAMDTVFIRKGKDEYENCETAFAKLDNEDAHCFIGDYNFNRWGWTNLVTEGEYDLPYYAGAAQCDVDKGLLVGNVHVTFMDGQVSVEYQMMEGYVLSEAHVYVGCEPYPMKNGKPTVAPGQFTFNTGDLDHSTGITVNFTDVVGESVYVIVHGVSCEEVCRCSERPGPDDGTVYDYTETIDCTEPAAEISKGNSGKQKVTTDVSIVNLDNLKVYPNPFNEVVNIEFVSGVSGHAVLEVHNMVGQRVATLLDQFIEAGVENKVQFRPESEVSGFYLYKLEIDGQIQIGKMIYRRE